MSDTSITLETIKSEKKKQSASRRIMVVYIIVLLAIILGVSNFIGKQFFNVVLFSLIFTFPLFIIYRVQIAQLLPESIASSLVNVADDAKEQIEEIEMPNTTKSDVVILGIGILCILISVFTFFSRVRKYAKLAKGDVPFKDEIGALLTMTFFTIVGMIFINDLF